MKKVLIVLGLLFIALTAKSQSMSFMGTWTGPKFISDYFWSNEKINVFSTNEVTYFNSELAFMTRDYAEFKLGNSNFYVHPEFQLFSDESYAGLVGLGYQLPVDWMCIMPVVLYRYDNVEGHTYHVELNTSGDWWKIHYEGYIDLWGIKTLNKATEQKVFFKITENFQLGVDLLYDDYNKFLVLGALRVAL